MYKKYGLITIGSIFSGYTVYKYYKNRRNKEIAKEFNKHPLLSWKPPTREETIKVMMKKRFDILVIGAGSAGSGCALDSITRGFSTCLIDSGDFGGETSSKSTKLLHGGIRYLEQAFKKLDIGQFKLVYEALQERKTIMKNAPYLTKKLPIMLPIYRNFMIPYFFAGLKVYDYIANIKSLGSSYFLSKNHTIEKFPAIKKENLVGSVVYYDGQFDDARYNVMLACTSAYYGASVSNYIEVIEIKRKNNKIIGVVVKDKMSDKIFSISAKCVINATGPFIDKIRSMDEKKMKKIVAPSSGTHIILPREFAPNNMGLVLPSTEDGRILFFIPWKGKALVGTTDNKCKVTHGPKPHNHEVDFILNEIKDNIMLPEIIQKKYILSAWTGIRPLILDSKSNNTSDLIRNHMIEVTKDKLITISGGKWTTYRKMAEETINVAIQQFNLKPKRECITKHVKLLGSHRYDLEFHLRLMNDLKVPLDIAKHLSRTYGDRSYKILPYIRDNYKRLTNNYNYITAEVEYCIDNEMAITISDIIARRMMLGLVDVAESQKCINTIADLMAKKLNWTRNQKRNEIAKTIKYMETFGSKFINEK